MTTAELQYRIPLCKARTVAFSGHRSFKMQEPDLFAGLSVKRTMTLAEILDNQVAKLYREGFNVFLCGMAEGFDLEAGEAVLRLKQQLQERGRAIPLHGDPVRLVAVIPFLKQAQYFENDTMDRYRNVLAAADDSLLLSSAYYRGCFHRRNDFLTDHSSTLLCYYNGSKGGTQYTVQRAHKAGLKVINLY